MRMFLIFRNGIQTWRIRSLGLIHNQMWSLLNLNPTPQNFHFITCWHLFQIYREKKQRQIWTQKQSSNRTPNTQLLWWIWWDYEQNEVKESNIYRKINNKLAFSLWINWPIMGYGIMTLFYYTMWKIQHQKVVEMTFSNHFPTYLPRYHFVFFSLFKTPFWI